jgi:hypothetical protein
LNIAESLFRGEGDDSFADIVNGKVEGLATDKIRAWLTRMAVSPATSPRGAVFFNGQYQPLDEVSRQFWAGHPDKSSHQRLYLQRWTDRIMQDYMGQLNYLMQPVSPACCPTSSGPRDMTTRHLRASPTISNRLLVSTDSFTTCLRRLPEGTSTFLWENPSDRRPSWIPVRSLAPTRWSWTSSSTRVGRLRL